MGLPKPLADLNARLKLACEGKDEGNNIPNVAVIAADRDGKIIHSASFGTYNAWPAPKKRKNPMTASESTPTTLLENLPSASNEPGPVQPFTADTVCWIASCTKLMVTVAALQCVERGLLTLDGDISDILPEFKDMDILVKITDEEGPILRKATKKQTLRFLLTHANGVAYGFAHPKAAAYDAWLLDSWRDGSVPRPKDPVHRAYLRPLLFEPGEGWAYSLGTDWAGVAVARVTKMPLEEYFSQNIWKPLGMTSTTFFPFTRSDLQSRMASMAARGEGEKLEPVDPFDSVWARPPQGWPESGGGGCYSTANDYIRFLTSLLKNDGKLLKPETRDSMFKPHLNDPKHLRLIHASPLAFGMAGNLPADCPVDHGLGGIINQSYVEKTGRSANSIQWSGLPNLFWFINPEDGICGFYCSQLLPTADVQSAEHYIALERAVNAVVKGKGSSAKL